MFRRAQNVKPGHTNLLIKALCLIELLPFTNKQSRTIKYTCDAGYRYMDLSFLVFFPLSHLKLYYFYFGIRYVFLLQ